MQARISILRLQLYSILKSDWSGAWLLLPIVARTMNSIVSTGYSHKIVIMCVKWNLFSKSQFLETHCLLFCSDIRTFLLPGQCGDDEEGIDRLVVASSESYVRNSTP